MNPQTTPETASNRKQSPAKEPPKKRAKGAGRKPKQAGRKRVRFFASVDSLAVGEINRRASLAGQSVNDWLSAVSGVVWGFMAG